MIAWDFRRVGCSSVWCGPDGPKDQQRSTRRHRRGGRNRITDPWGRMPHWLPGYGWVPMRRQSDTTRSGTGTVDTNSLRKHLRSSRLRHQLKVKLVGVCLGSLIAFSITGCSSSSAGFPSGSGVATITWHRVATTSSLQSPPQPFSGTIAGIPVSGRSVTPVPKANQNPGGGISIPSHLVLARWTGTFQGTDFLMTVSVGDLSITNLSSVTFDISGKFGSQIVHGTGRASSSQQSQLTFQGTVGHHHVVGSVKEPVEQGGSGTATATFTVTG